MLVQNRPAGFSDFFENLRRFSVEFEIEKRTFLFVHRGVPGLPTIATDIRQRRRMDSSSYTVYIRNNDTYSKYIEMTMWTST